MKFKAIRSKFLDGLKSVQNIVAGKGSLPILQNVMIESAERSIRLTTTDLDISIKAEVECEVLEGGSTTLPVKLLFTSITKAAEGEVEIEVDSQERATIKAGSARFKLQGMPASEFPQLPEEGDAFSYTIPQATIREMLRKTSYAASQDDTRRMLKGVLMSFKDEKLTEGASRSSRRSWSFRRWPRRTLCFPRRPSPNCSVRSHPTERRPSWSRRARYASTSPASSSTRS